MEQLVYSPKSLGVALRRKRKSLSKNQTEVGKEFRIGQKSVSSAEQGSGGTRVDTLFRLLAALDLEMVIRSKGT